MASIRQHIHKAIFYNSHGSSRMVPADILVANCRAAGYSATAVREELSALVEAGELCEADDHYARATEPGDDPLDIQTYRGSESTPWQFSVKWTPDEIVVTQARGPAEQFDPVVKRFTIEEQPLGAEPVEFHHAVSRRVWSEDSDHSQVRSQRSEGHIIELLYRSPTGRHLDRPDSQGEDTTTSDGDEYEATDHPGVTVSSTFIRAENEDEVKFTEERDYRVSRRILDECAEVFVLSYYEVNEESVENAIWDVEDAIAYRLVSKNGTDD